MYVPPNTTSKSGLPVKVWVSGDGKTGEIIADALYSGCDLAKSNTIVVTVNYRCGPLGFLALSRAGIEGNLGVHDIILALQWVQSNIASFGGDKVSYHILEQAFFDKRGINTSIFVDKSSVVRTVCRSCHHIFRQYAR